MIIHFLNVGHGDCCIVKHDSGHLSVIDINNAFEYDTETSQELYSSVTGLDPLLVKALSTVDSHLLKRAGYDINLTNPIEFLNSNYPGESIFRYVQTHPHLDHMRGLDDLQSANIPIFNFWDTDHSFVPDISTISDQSSWDAYRNLQNDGGITRLRLYQKETGVYYNENPAGVWGGDGIEILYPTKSGNQEANRSGQVNNLSYILRVTANGITTILGGDGEKEAWDAVVKEYGPHLKCDVLKASHHGRDSGYHQEAVSLMSPEYTIVSVGKKPATDASNKYQTYSTHVWSTRWKGTVTLNTATGKILAQHDR